jgi:hypothetical protein
VERPKSFTQCVLNDLLRKDRKELSSANRRRSFDKLKKTGVPSCSSKQEGCVFSQTPLDVNRGPVLDVDEKDEVPCDSSSHHKQHHAPDQVVF